ncbi:MAG: hypothetical protein ACLQBD_25715 [Syntrophobacteraceae bacterium]
MTTEYSEKWAEICFLLSDNIRENPSEKEFESQVVRAIEALGWREFRNEIERQPTIQLGREGTLRPDLIVRGNENKCLIVVEVKRPIEDITKDYVIGQLRSYMRQMKSDFGFLIGTDLRIYYDGSLNPHSDPILIERIDFDKTSESGITFVTFFNKASLIGNKYTVYLNEKLNKFNKTKQVSMLIQQLTSYETRQKVIGYLRNEVPDTDDETFSEALQQISIEISQKVQAEQETSIAQQKGRLPKRKIINGHLRDQVPPVHYAASQSSAIEMVKDKPRIASIPFESRLGIRLRHIYGVLYFMKQGLDFPIATHQTLKLFPEVQDYQTISDKCARGFAGNVDTFISWFQSGEMLDKLIGKFSLSDHDANIFKKLLS